MKRKVCISVVAVTALATFAAPATAQAAYPGEFSRTTSPVASLAEPAARPEIGGQLMRDALTDADFLISSAAPGDQTAQAQGQNVPLSVVLRNIRSRYPGKHLDTRLTGNKYKVIWLTPDGRRLDILADARTGNIISVRGD